MLPLVTIFATGGSSLFDRAKFLALGGLNEMLAPYGWEDVELSLRAWKQGFEIRYEPRSAIWHQFSSTIGARVSRRRVSAAYERNRLLMHWLHLDTRGQAASHALGLAGKLAAARSPAMRNIGKLSDRRGCCATRCASSALNCKARGSARSPRFFARSKRKCRVRRSGSWTAPPRRCVLTRT